MQTPRGHDRSLGARSQGERRLTYPTFFKDDRQSREKPTPTKKKRKSLAPVSHKQEIRTAFLQGIRAERMRIAPTCEVCSRTYRTLEEAWQELDLHHTEKRSQGQGYRGALRWGVDAPELLLLVCRRCHIELESNPQWKEGPPVRGPSYRT